MRLVSLACSNTEIVCALGCGEWLVGIDNYSDRPLEVVADLPRVGPDLEIDIEAVCELDPDLVLASLTVPGHEQVVEGLEAAGLEYLALEPVSLADVYADIRTVARALGAGDKGEDIISSMRSQMSLTQTFAKPPVVLVQWWNRPTITPGRLSWVTALIALAGGVNPLSRTNVKSSPVTDEQVAIMNPDAIVLSWCGVAPEKYRSDAIYNNPAWRDIKAVRNGHVFTVPEAYLGRPGPGLVQGFEAVKEIVRRVAL